MRRSVYKRMQSISARVDDETYAELEELADERGSSTSAVVRDLIERGMDYDELKARHDDLQRQLAAVNARQEDVGELVEYVEEERKLQRRSEERRNAPVWTRAKWWLVGRDSEPPDGE